MLNLFAQMFHETDYDLYRVDSLPSEPPFEIRPDEVIVLLHIGRLNSEALDLRAGEEMVHMICSGVNYLDINGRYPGEAEGWQLYPTLDYWL
jgi:hypothetical protein